MPVFAFGLIGDQKVLIGAGLLVLALSAIFGLQPDWPTRRRSDYPARPSRAAGRNRQSHRAASNTITSRLTRSTSDARPCGGGGVFSRSSRTMPSPPSTYSDGVPDRATATCFGATSMAGEPRRAHLAQQRALRRVHLDAAVLGVRHEHPPDLVDGDAERARAGRPTRRWPRSRRSSARCECSPNRRRRSCRRRKRQHHRLGQARPGRYPRGRSDAAARRSDPRPGCDCGPYRRRTGCRRGRPPDRSARRCRDGSRLSVDCTRPLASSRKMRGVPRSTT